MIHSLTLTNAIVLVLMLGVGLCDECDETLSSGTPSAVAQASLAAGDPAPTH